MAEISKNAAERRGIRPVSAARGADTAALVRLGRAAGLRSAPCGRVIPAVRRTITAALLWPFPLHKQLRIRRFRAIALTTH
jgi:hypothetical protein